MFDEGKWTEWSDYFTDDDIMAAIAAEDSV